MDREQLLRYAMTELEERLLRDGYVPEHVDESGSRGWHIPSIPVTPEPARSVAATVTGLVLVSVAILGLVILLRGWPS